MRTRTTSCDRTGAEYLTVIAVFLSLNMGYIQYPSMGCSSCFPFFILQNTAHPFFLTTLRFLVGGLVMVVGLPFLVSHNQYDSASSRGPHQHSRLFHRANGDITHQLSHHSYRISFCIPRSCRFLFTQYGSEELDALIGLVVEGFAEAPVRIVLIIVYLLLLGYVVKYIHEPPVSVY